uniref:DUF4657 domain-containing protein n=1 Tax=Accipiter nisus TaxID=211598 RepID=A0A8B9NAC5_9AVES
MVSGTAGAAVGWLRGLGGVVGPCPGVASALSCLCLGVPPHPTPPGLPGPADGPWETAESCVVHTSASVYRRLQESPRQPPGGMNAWGPPPPPPISPGSPPASGRLLKSESEDSGVEMASNDHSPPTPLGSESSFSLDGFPPEKNPPGEEPGTEPPRPSRSRSASKKLVQAAQRSRRQRGPGRCPRQFGRRSANAADLPAEPAGQLQLGGLVSPVRSQGPVCPQAVPEPVLPVPGQGLRYLEHVCQMLERLARLQQDNRILRQQAAGGGPTGRPLFDGCVSPPAGRPLALGPGEGAAHPPDPPLAAGRPMQVEPERGSPVPPPPLDRGAALHLLRHAPNKAFSLPKRRLFCEAVCSCAVTSLSSAPA